MPCSSRTADFRELLLAKQKLLSETQRRKISKRPAKGETNDQNPLGKEYVAEAYTILNHITTLTHMLATVRKPYLNVDSRQQAGSSRLSSRNIDLASSDGTSWSNIRHLTNEERDQVDLQARVILSRCADRVKEMEALEKRRVELVASKQSPFTRLLPARLRTDASTASSDFVAAHHSSITWYLNRRLADASQTQKEMQEERVKRQLERTRTLGSGVAREAATMSLREPSRDRSVGSGGGGWLASSIAATIGAPSPSESSANSSPYIKINASLPPDDLGLISSEDEDEEMELSASQIQQFEAENAQILRKVQDTLESVQQAESRLMDISALQMELVTHLTRQSELTDQLYEDAIATTGMVEKGNQQLREAKRRAEGGRLYILFMFVGLSFSLLFIHYY